MRNFVQRISLLLHAFRQNQSGNVAIETVIIFPIIVWAYLAMFTIFDLYRQVTTQQKAAYTISDLISRQATPMDASFMDGTHALFQHLSRTNGVPGLRVTVAKYDLVNEEYVVVWSRTRGGMVSLSSQDIANWSNNLPVLPQDDQIIIVETSSSVDPVFRVGLGEQAINNFIFTRPRYAKQVCFEAQCNIVTPAPMPPSDDETA